jgi:hypothetical protein
MVLPLLFRVGTWSEHEPMQELAILQIDFELPFLILRPI